jgi:hypothetical protein
MNIGVDGTQKHNIFGISEKKLLTRFLFISYLDHIEMLMMVAQRKQPLCVAHFIT